MPLITLLLNLVMPLPIRTDRTLQKVPYVTYCICFACILVYVCTLGLSKAQLNSFNNTWGFSVDHATLVTLFTHAFLHSGFLHLASNLLVFWIVGTVLEAGIGSLLFSLLYLACLVAAVLLHGIIIRLAFPADTGQVLIGASGAIAGVTGFAAFRYFHTRIFTLVTVPPLGYLYPLLGLIPVYGFWLPMWGYAVYFGGKELLAGLFSLSASGGDEVAHWAHVGGMGLGILAAWLLRTQKEGQRENVLEVSAKSTEQGIGRVRSMQEVWELLKANPEDPELLEAMAGLAMGEGRTTHAADYYRLAIRHFLAGRRAERAAISYLNLLQLIPEEVLDVHDQMTVASSLEKQGLYPPAATAYTAVADHYPEREESQTALLRAAQINYRYLGDLSASRDLLQRLLEQYPTSNWTEIARERLRDL